MWTFHEEFTLEARQPRGIARRESGWFMVGLIVVAILTAILGSVRAGADSMRESSSPSHGPVQVWP